MQREAAMLGCVAGVQDLEGRRGSGWACAAFCRGFPCATPVMGIFDIDSHGSLVWLTTARYDQFLVVHLPAAWYGAGRLGRAAGVRGQVPDGQADGVDVRSVSAGDGAEREVSRQA